MLKASNNANSECRLILPPPNLALKIYLVVFRLLIVIYKSYLNLFILFSKKRLNIAYF